MDELSQGRCKVSNEIGYYIRSISKNVKEATELMEAMKITSVDYKDGVVSITTARPGVVIGKHGILIGGITNYLKKMSSLFVSEVLIIEDRYIGELYVFQYEGFDGTDSW